MLQTAMTLLFGTASDAQVPTLGASGAIAAVLGAYFLLYPRSRVLTLVLWIPAWIYLGGWFVYQLFESHFALVSAKTGGSGVAFSRMSVDSCSACWPRESWPNPGASPPKRDDDPATTRRGALFEWLKARDGKQATGRAARHQVARRPASGSPQPAIKTLQHPWRAEGLPRGYDGRPRPLPDCVCSSSG